MLLTTPTSGFPFSGQICRHKQQRSLSRCSSGFHQPLPHLAWLLRSTVAEGREAAAAPLSVSNNALAGGRALKEQRKATKASAPHDTTSHPFSHGAGAHAIEAATGGQVFELMELRGRQPVLSDGYDVRARKFEQVVHCVPVVTEAIAVEADQLTALAGLLVASAVS